MIKKVVNNTNFILNSLKSDQTIIQLFTVYTTHKITYISVVNIINQDYNDLPNNWNLWLSDMAEEFTKMTENALCKIKMLGEM